MNKRNIVKRALAFMLVLFLLILLLLVAEVYKAAGASSYSNAKHLCKKQ